MTKNEFEALALDLLEAAVNVGAQNKLVDKDLVRDHSKTETRAFCLARALTLGLSSAFNAWTVLGSGGLKGKVGNVTILGGGCAFMIPVLMEALPKDQRELTVRVIDPISHWRMFQPSLVRHAEKNGIRLHLDFVPEIDLLEQIDSYRTDLLVALDGLGERRFAERRALRTAYATCNRHLIWDSNLSVMQEIFHATFIPQRGKVDFFCQKELSEFLQHHYPLFAQGNVFANFGNRGFYLMHNLIQGSHLDGTSRTVGFTR